MWRRDESGGGSYIRVHILVIIPMHAVTLKLRGRFTSLLVSSNALFTF